MIEVSNGETHTLVQDDLVQGLFGNRLLGNVDPRFGDFDEFQANRMQAFEYLIGQEATKYSKLITMVVACEPGFVDLDDPTIDFDHVPVTDGLITTNPRLVLSGNPADCEMIAMYGEGDNLPVLGLIHVGRTIAEQNGHGQALDYISDTYGLNPEDARFIFPPSIRGNSYKFPDISDEQKADPKWADYVHQDEEGMWHVEVRQRVIDELQADGVHPDNIYSSPVDVGSHPDYFSHRQHLNTGQPSGRNSVMFRLIPS